MENKQQTAVEWIFSQLPDEYTTTRSGFDVYQIAKEMEKDQIIDAYETSHISMMTSEQYYNETYGGNK